MFSVLVVDDEKVVLEGICRYIEKTDLPLKLVACTRNGMEALSFCVEQRPDIIVTDIKMPGMDGIQLTKAILEIDSYSPCIIAISAYSDFSYIHQLIKNRYVTDYILKPIDKKELHSSLSKAIDLCRVGGPRNPSVESHEAEEFPSPENSESQWSEYGITAIAPLVRKVIDYVELNYMNPDITLAEIAKQLYVSPNYRSFCFKKEMGIGFTVYVRNLRIERSKALLQDITLKIYEVANQVGIPDSRYYARIFKEVTGISPKDYRKKCM